MIKCRKNSLSQDQLYILISDLSTLILTFKKLQEYIQRSEHDLISDHNILFIVPYKLMEITGTNILRLPSMSRINLRRSVNILIHVNNGPKMKSFAVIKNVYEII